MTKSVLKNKLRKAIGEVQDEHVLEALYSILYSHLHAEEMELSKPDKLMLDERLKKHEAGKDKSMTWEEAKTKIRKRLKIR